MPALLNLAAEDEEDLKAISALMQDSILRVGDLAWLPKARRFACVLNRYRWEAGLPGGRGERVRCGLHVENVLKVQSARIRQDAKDAVLSLLALTWSQRDGGDGELSLTFAGGGTIRLEVEAIDVRLHDLTGAWPAKARPSHETD
jgi:hypothetical protein